MIATYSVKLKGHVRKKCNGGNSSLGVKSENISMRNTLVTSEVDKVSVQLGRNSMNVHSIIYSPTRAMLGMTVVTGLLFH